MTDRATHPIEMPPIFPADLPAPWMAGYVHHHTAFGFPPRHRVTPQELQDEVAELGGDFVFCAGDHDCSVDGELCPPWYEGRDYYDLVLAANSEGRVLLLPTGEYHLWFPDHASRDRTLSFWRHKEQHPDYQPFHHTLIPMLEWTDAVCRHVRENTSERLLEAAGSLGIVPTLNHPGLCYLSGHPDPLAIGWLKRMPYVEMFNTMRQFDYDWALYKHYLSRPESCDMAVFAGVDFTSHRGRRLSTPGNECAEHVTYIHVPGARSLESLHRAWAQRRTVAVRGRLYLERISHVPQREPHPVSGYPEISFSVRNFGGKRISRIEILRDGVRAYCDYPCALDAVDLSWRDEQFQGKLTHYTLAVEAQGDWLITSPIAFAPKP